MGGKKGDFNLKRGFLRGEFGKMFPRGLLEKKIV
jgi:hypothetical protein